MNNFKDGGFKKKRKEFGGRPKFGGGGFGNNRRPGGGFGGGGRGGNSGGEKELFSATCSACHKNCDVPFRPNGEKPVFCSACFNKKNSDGPREQRGGDRNEYREQRSDRRDSSEYSRPAREQRPVHNDAPRAPQMNGLEDLKRQLTTIEARLNRILDLINPPMPAVKAVTAKVAPTEAAAEILPKKVRKPKTVKVKAATPKKVATKAKKTK